MLGIKVAVNRDPRAIQDTIKEVRPTCMCAVPRFWEKVYAAVHEKIASMNPVARMMVNAALKVGRKRNIEYKRRGLEAPWWLESSYKLFDRKVFAMLRGAIGIDHPNIFPDRRRAGFGRDSGVFPFGRTVSDDRLRAVGDHGYGDLFPYEGL